MKKQQKKQNSSKQQEAAPFQKQTADKRPDGKFAPGNKIGNRFKPGQSGNPGGLPKGTPKLSVAYSKLLASDPDEEFKPRTRAEQIALGVCVKAAGGDMQAAKEMADRTEGKSPATININSSSAKAEGYQRIAEELARKYGKPIDEVIRGIIKRDPEAAQYFEGWVM
jgi:hypothetical protein